MSQLTMAVIGQLKMQTETGIQSLYRQTEKYKQQ